MRVRIIIAVVFLGFAFVDSSWGIPPGYTFTDLGSGQARAINNLGQVAGTFGLWDNGTVTPLGGIAWGINDSGQVVGDFGLWDNGTFVSISGNLRDINNSGQVVGGDGRPFLWENGVKTYLGTVDGLAVAINESGQVTGETHEEYQHAFLWQDGVMTDLGTLGGYTSTPYDISESGIVVGESRTSGYAGSVGFQYLDNVLTPLADGSDRTPRGINSLGQIAGIDYQGDDNAFVWEDNLFYDLNDLIPPDTNLDLWYAFDINDSGQIVGYGWTDEWEVRSYLLTPIPEPATLSLLVLGGLVLIRRRRK